MSYNQPLPPTMTDLSEKMQKSWSTWLMQDFCFDFYFNKNTYDSVREVRRTLVTSRVFPERLFRDIFVIGSP